MKRIFLASVILIASQQVIAMSAKSANSGQKQERNACGFIMANGITDTSFLFHVGLNLPSTKQEGPGDQPQFSGDGVELVVTTNSDAEAELMRELRSKQKRTCLMNLTGQEAID